MGCRLATRVGIRYTRGAWWGDGCPTGVPDPDGRMRHSTLEDGGDGRIDDSWVPTICDRCGVPFSGPTEFPAVARHTGAHPTYDTEDGRLHPGDMVIVPHYRADDGTEHCSGRWTNCDGQHLHVMLPDATEWDVDGRATNCTLPDDPTHRCWVREGEPPVVTAGKTGHTCSAGAGSIQTGRWHGFLRNGELLPC